MTNMGNMINDYVRLSRIREKLTMVYTIDVSDIIELVDKRIEELKEEIRNAR